MAVLIPNGTTMHSKDERFFKTLGNRIAQARKARNITQQQLADHLGIAQQTLANYEVARLRLPTSMLPQLSEILGRTPDELLGYEAKPKPKHRPVSRLDKQIERVRQLPRSKQQVLMDIMEGFLSQAGH